MRYNIIKPIDIANGPHVRVSLFVQGCSHHCKGCFNPETWDAEGGKVFGESEYQELMSLLDHEYIRGLSVLGGEPLEQCHWMRSLLRNVKSAYPDKTVWLYTGYVYEALSPLQSDVLEYVDILVDGPFIEDKKIIDLQYRGSTNQRLIDVKASRAEGRVVLWTPQDWETI